VSRRVIKCWYSLNVLKDTYDHSCYLARSYEYQHLMADSPAARAAGRGAAPSAAAHCRAQSRHPRRPPQHRGGRGWRWRPVRPDLVW
jgi:hypothetical protein